MKFFTLIHICSSEESLHNSRTANFNEQIRLYLSCAKKLHYSLKLENVELSILTNDKAYLQKLLPDNFDIEIIELVFSLEVPSGIKFYSAHFKLEVFNFLAQLNDPYVGLLDSDIVCVNKMPRHFKNIVELGIPLYYDITDQTAPAYGIEILISDKEKLINKKSFGLWAGGEYISGPPSFFRALYQEVGIIKENYFSSFNTFHHQGDEMITSIAIEKLMVDENVRIVDAGSLGIIGRFWSPNTLHIQKSIKAYYNHFLLHLPADKNFIAALQNNDLKGGSFFKQYRRYLAGRSYRKVVSRLVRRS